MRGSPLLRALLAFLAILALGYPLRQVTRAGDPDPAEGAAAPASASPAAAGAQILLQLSFTTAPTSFAVKHLGQEVWKESSATASAERTLTMPFPQEGVELQFSATFPAGSPLAAARLVLTDPAGEKHERSLWGEGSIDEVVSFP